MTDREIQELFTRGQRDGAQLFKVANAIYIVAIAMNIAIGLVGAVLFLVALNSAGIGVALAVGAATAVICLIVYALAVLGSGGAKVLVHLLFSNLAMVEAQRGGLS